MPWKETNRSALGLFLAVSVFVVIGGAWFANLNYNTSHEQQSWVEHTWIVTDELEKLLSAAKDAETGIRGFQLTGEREYLEPYNNGVAQIWVHFNKFKSLTTDNPIQLENARVLEGMLRERLATLAEGLEARLRGTKLNMSMANEGRSKMESLRKLVERMQQEEQKLLERRVEIENESQRYFHISILLTTILSVIVLVGAFWRIRLDQARGALEAAEKEKESWLQGQVAEVVQLAAEEGALKLIGRKVLEQLREGVPLAVGNLYWLIERELFLVASYGIDKGQVPERVPIAQSGLLADAFQRPDVTQLRNLPSGYFRVSSTLGQALPGVVTFVPLMAFNRKVGILEIAGFEELNPRQLELLSILREPLGASLNSVQSREALQSLLDQTQFQAEELQAQQEELRTNNEELEQQARAMEAQKQALALRNTEMEQARQLLEQRASELERASQYKSDFLAKMSHELRTPLNSLLILATLLTENKEGNLNARQIDFAKSIRGAGTDLLTLINDILDLSKIEARKLMLRAEPFSVEDLATTVERTFLPQAEAKKIKFTVEVLPSAGGELFTDRMRLEQVLRNFLSNALKFTEKGEVKLVIGAGGTGEDITFAVHDSGVGIQPDKLHLIFDAFEQADGSVSRKFGGTGLGLTISRELAQLLGGDIHVESVFGEGSTFELEIPRHLKSQPTQPEESPSITSLPQSVDVKKASAVVVNTAREAIQNLPKDAKTILIVEDDQIFRETVASTARGYGFTPIEISEGEVALEVLNLHRPSAILLDVKLPGISGLGVLELIKRRPEFRHIPIHIISAMDYQQNAYRLGAMGYLSKPVALDNLRAALGRIEGMLSLKMKRLLIVEDDQRQRQAIRELVQGQDIEIEAVANGEEAVRAIQTEHFDCVILDLSLPDLSGFEVLKKLNGLGQILPPIVIYTAQTLTAQQEEFLRKYSESIIIKGARSPERLLDEVNLFLHRVEARLPEDKRAMLEGLRGQEPSFSGRELLLVDDDLRNIFALTSALESRGFQVTIARDGVEAIETLEAALTSKKVFDAILMDLMMPRMDGLEAMRRIRVYPQYKATPIIALTAKAMKEDQEKCLAAGATDYLPKPIDLKNLFSVLNVWLSRENLFL